ncbi:MAG: NgoFVII family restriction endonuclease [Thalassospira sp.]|jgi:HKD family nuclease|uniref:Phospholipase D-like domain-containing protein n=2 Tax=Thalassospiraceae TaxID=2844866 RepID=A0ABR5XYF7_9PROT|nr:phospholipase D family protein [Thalassospira xiamenensis]KZC97370.1 hypothetical protein AUP40_05445 [Thalassospira xiamenensis]KZD10033.1 hypothetical protein AUP45_01770 [Thalassospira xiamenensis]MAL28018.1 NgoFVII family restriction endonuclease [Thalassospira sp.]HBN47873.1 NgoFVII family restriction endonuclease [Thalassospira sp.]|tara:strand:- start:495 stop:1691 length:1197 start_codon:yes stop_codon:yes gene_type:complete
MGDVMSSKIQFLVNGYDRDHGQEIISYLEDADHFECLAAFATGSADGFADQLKAALKRGMTARIAIGLSSYVTQPALLQSLLSLTKNNAFQLYLSHMDSEIFHPKIYCFRKGKRTRVLIGSANLTGGGFKENYEASAVVDNSEILAAIENWFDDLIDEEVLLPASKSLIQEYEAAYEKNRVWQNLIRRQQMRIEQQTPEAGTLVAMLAEMRKDTTKEGFDQEIALRARNARTARDIIANIAQYSERSDISFDKLYGELLNCFHSSGIVRSKSEVCKQANIFAAAMEEILSYEIKSLKPTKAYEILSSRFQGITGAGVNLLTEILHALDAERFAVMNGNATRGMNLANIYHFPTILNKTSIKPETYALFCETAERVKAKLNLDDMMELDALFNYCYWRI